MRLAILKLTITCLLAIASVKANDQNELSGSSAEVISIQNDLNVPKSLATVTIKQDEIKASEFNIESTPVSVSSVEADCFKGGKPKPPHKTPPKPPPTPVQTAPPINMTPVTPMPITQPSTPPQVVVVQQPTPAPSPPPAQGQQAPVVTPAPPQRIIVANDNSNSGFLNNPLWIILLIVLLLALLALLAYCCWRNQKTTEDMMMTTTTITTPTKMNQEVVTEEVVTTSTEYHPYATLPAEGKFNIMKTQNSIGTTLSKPMPSAATYGTWNEKYGSANPNMFASKV